MTIAHILSHGFALGAPVVRPFSATSSSAPSRQGRTIRMVTSARGGGYTGYRPPRPSGGGGGGGRFRSDRNQAPYRPQIPMNENIQASEVRLIDDAKEPLGVMSTEEALEMARDAGMDLILVVPDASPPVARLIQYSKFNYEQVKAAKDAKKKQRESMIETKELKMRPGTDVHDYDVKVRAAQKFLAKGARVKLTVQFKGREMEFKEIGREMFTRFLEDLGGVAAVSVEQPMQMQGRQMNMVLGPKKE